MAVPPTVVVVDSGGHVTRAGYAGEQYPDVLVPSVGVALPHDEGGGVRFGETALGLPLPYTVRTPHDEGGDVGDVDLWGELVRHSIERVVQRSPLEGVVVVLVHRPWDTPVAPLLDTLFEGHGVEAVAVVRSSTAVCYGLGLVQGMVVDCGETATSVAPVLEGSTVVRSVVRTPFGASCTTKDVASALQRRGVTPAPRNTFDRSLSAHGEVLITPLNLQDTFSKTDYWLTSLHREVKEATLLVSPSPDTAPRGMVWDLPDGKVVELREERSAIPEVYFSSPPFSAASPDIMSPVVPMVRDTTGLMLHRPLLSLQDMVLRSARTLDDPTPLLDGNVVLCGGGAAIPTFRERFEKDLYQLLLQERVVIREGARSLVPVPTSELPFMAWKGGSVFASWPGMPETWITRTDFLDGGCSAVHPSFCR
eukprot:Sspe_Gene.20779::Locus_7655_Transcript_1_1_Confidence_1.000_Length_1449::g.20779::m.20779/K11340/ACTL6A, INO80K; actin-like protein 6A